MQSNSQRTQKIRSSSQSVAASILLDETKDKNTIFWQEWQANQDYLSHCCLKWMNSNPIDAEEVLSQAMLKAWTEWQNYGSKIKYPKAWLTKIIYNFCIDLHRKRKRDAVTFEKIEDIKFEDHPVFSFRAEFPESKLLDCEILPLAVGKVSTPPTPPCQGGAKRTRGENSIKVPLFKGDLGGSPGDIVEQMLKRFPQRWSVWATAARVLVEYFKEFERGCSVSEQGIKLQPQLADAWFRHGRVLALAGKHREAVQALEKGWKLLPAGISLQFVPTAVWLAESYQVLGDVGASQRWWKVAGEGCQELKAFNGAMADYWLGRALVGLRDKLGAIQAYESALSQQLLYPARGEVEKSLLRLKGKRGKGCRG